MAFGAIKVDGLKASLLKMLIRNKAPYIPPIACNPKISNFSFALEKALTFHP